MSHWETYKTTTAIKVHLKVILITMIHISSKNIIDTVFMD